MIAKETKLVAVDYLGGADGDMVKLYLGSPNIELTLKESEARDPLTVGWRIRSIFHNRHTPHGKAFDSPTRKLCEKRWRELWELAAIGRDGEFYPLEPDADPVGIESVLRST